MLLKKEQGGCMVAGYEWVNDGDVVDVTPDEVALSLLAIKGAGYSHVEETEPAPGQSAADDKAAADKKAAAQAKAAAAEAEAEQAVAAAKAAEAAAAAQ